MPETPAPMTMTSASRAAPDSSTCDTPCSMAMFVTFLGPVGPQRSGQHQ
jgi:hypothetical protein